MKDSESFGRVTLATVEVLPTCQGPGRPAKWPAVRYGDYLLERLDKNYAYRQPVSA